MSRRPPFADLALPARPPEVDAWRWVYRALRAAILERRLKPGAQLPSTRDLARQYGLARGTVTTAYRQLLAEGFTVAHAGAGTFVSSDLARSKRGWSPRRGASTPPTRVSRAAEAALGQMDLPRPLPGVGRAFRPYEPALDLFPADLWARTVARVLRQASRQLYGHGDPAGYLPLRRAIAEYLGHTRGVRCSPEQVFVTSGAQQALSLIGRVLLDTGDTAWVEDPGYAPVRQAWAAAGARIVNVPVDRDGLCVSAGRALAPNARVAYVTPANQFPLGTTMSVRRRLELLEWAAGARTWIVEDDYDAEYRFSGRPLAALQSFDRVGSVIYVGTFTKLLFNAIRLGFMVLPDGLIDYFARVRSIEDRHAPSLDQAALADFIVDGSFARHVRQMRHVYAERHDVLKDACDRRLRGILTLEAATAGMKAIGWLTRRRSDKSAATAARSRGLEVTPVSLFAADATTPPGLILGFAGVSPDALRRGVDTLARALEQNR